MELEALVCFDRWAAVPNSRSPIQTDYKIFKMKTAERLFKTGSAHSSRQTLVVNRQVPVFDSW